MRTYKLDNLQDWGRVLEELEELRRLRLLDEYQDGLKRILRYRRNWRLRECALQCVKEVAAPRKDLVQEVCSIMCDEDVYPELRMLAVDTIRELALADARITSLPYYRGTTILEEMEALIGIPMHPLLQARIVRCQRDCSKGGRPVRTEKQMVINDNDEKRLRGLVRNAERSDAGQKSLVEKLKAAMSRAWSSDHPPCRKTWLR